MIRLQLQLQGQLPFICVTINSRSWVHHIICRSGSSLLWAVIM